MGRINNKIMYYKRQKKGKPTKHETLKHYYSLFIFLSCFNMLYTEKIKAIKIKDILHFFKHIFLSK